MFHRSLPPRFWLLIGCVVLPLINAFNSFLITYFIERMNIEIGYFIGSFIVSYLYNLIVCFPLGLLSTIASENWKSGSYRAARFLCWSSGVISLIIFGYSFWFVLTKNVTGASNLSFLSQFPLLLIWSIGLILTGFLLRAPQRT